MATEIRLRRGTTAEHGNFNGAEGEITFDTDKHTIIVHNNEGNGTGRQVALLSDVQAVDTLAEILALSNTTGGNKIVFGDSTGEDDDRLTFGAGADLQIYHDGSNSYVKDANVGNLVLQGTDIALRDNVGNRKIFCEDGNDKGVDVHFGNEGVKLKTTTDGIDVTGEVKGDSLDIDGNADISGNLVLGGDLNVTGTTTTVNQTNLDVSDNIIGLNRGASTNSNDSGFIIERGSTGDNAVFVWDESADKFVLGTTTATPSSTGDLTITTGTLVANVEGNLTGTIQTAAQTNITSVGDLTALNVNGTVTADGLAIDGDSVINGEVDIQNGHKLSFFQSDNSTDGLQIFVDSSGHSHIAEANTTEGKHLYITGDRILLQESSSSTDKRINIGDNNGVKIYGDNKLRIVTGNGTYHGASLADSIFFYTGDGDAVDHKTMSVSPTGLDVTGTVNANAMTLGDNEPLTFNGNLEIKSNGNDSTITESDASGSLTIQGENFYIKNADSQALVTSGGGSVQLAHCPDASTSNKRLETTTNGVTISGTSGLIAEQATINGTVTADAITSNPTTDVNDGSGGVNVTLVLNKKFINTKNDAGRTLTLPASATAGNVIMIVNASSQTLTINRSTNSITTTVADTGQGMLSVSGNTFSILKGGVAEIVYTAASTAIAFGAGVLNV